MGMGIGIIFAGCGGTFWTATPMLAALVRKYHPRLCAFVDPDILEKANVERQWVTVESDGNTWPSKSTLARRAVMGPQEHDAISHVGYLPGRDVLDAAIEAQFLDMDIIVVCNVDNNESRLAIRKWCRKQPGYAAMIVSGCDKDHGQVYTGEWFKGEAVRDWLEDHPDVEKGGKPIDQCGQNIMANAQTGVLLGWALEDVLQRYDYPHLAVPHREYWWKRHEGTIKMWTDETHKEIVNTHVK